MPPTAFFSMHFPPGIIVFHSDTSASYVSMRGPRGESLPMREDASFFDDTGKKYAWAFAYDGSIVDSLTFTFLSQERQVTGEVAGSGIRVLETTFEPSGPVPLPKPRGLTRPRSAAANHYVKAVAPSVPARPIRKAILSTVTPKVSIATCTYNRPKFLQNAIESLKRQTDPSWEHLIFDNGSTDPDVEEVLDRAEEDPRVHVFRSPINRDQPALAWNYLLDRARGRYFTILDDDNEKLPQFIETMSKILDEDPNVDLVTSGWRVLDPDGLLDGEQHLNLLTSKEELLERSTCDGGATLFRRDSFEKVGYFSEAIRTNEDWDWIRRGSPFLRFRNLPECHATYRSHKTNRMRRMHELGHDADHAHVLRRTPEEGLAVRIVRPTPERLTRSQEDALGSVTRSLQTIPWVRSGNDLAIVLAPFQIPDQDLLNAVRGCARAVSVHLEDPYALSTNLDRVRILLRAVTEVWVSTNDRATLPHYASLVGSRVILCPSLGADIEPIPPPVPERDLDLLLCGYAYPSRKRLMEAILPSLADLRVLLVGDGWEEFSSRTETRPTQDLAETYRLHARAKLVLTSHRDGGDCSDGPVPPETCNRGFLEGASGARVLLDRKRSHHPFEENDVLWYDGPEDLVATIQKTLAEPPSPYAERLQEKCRILYSYQTRMKRILNCVRSPRFHAEIP